MRIAEHVKYFILFISIIKSIFHTFKINSNMKNEKQPRIPILTYCLFRLGAF